MNSAEISVYGLPEPATKIWPHAGSVGIDSTGHCQEKDNFQGLIERLRETAFDATGFTPAVATATLIDPRAHRRPPMRPRPMKHAAMPAAMKPRWSYFF